MDSNDSGSTIKSLLPDLNGASLAELRAPDSPALARSAGEVWADYSRPLDRSVQADDPL